MDVGKRITELREQRGLTTNRLATQSGLSQSFVRSVEMGQKGITIENLTLLCQALGVGIKDFFDDKEQEDRVVTSLELLKIVEKLTPDQRYRLAEFLKFI